MRVSICICMYNSESYITRCLSTIPHRQDIEVVIVDDCSSDGSIAAVDNYLSTKTELKYRIFKNQSNMGVGYNRNILINEAQGDYIFFLDSDDEITDDCIKKLSAVVEKDEEIEIVRYPVVSYELKDKVIVPIAPATMSQVTKSRQWWETLGCDERLISEKTMADGRKVVTIYGIESDAADREEIKNKFLKEIC